MIKRYLQMGLAISATLLTFSNLEGFAFSSPNSNEAANDAETTLIWKPSCIKNYSWDDSEWLLSDTQKIVYTNNGEIASCETIKSDGSVIRISNTWNENGMLATQLIQVAHGSDGIFIDSLRLKREYDEIITSLITLNDEEVWVEGMWQPSSNKYSNTITRNEHGNVTLLEHSNYSDSGFKPLTRLSVIYGEDNKATRLTESHIIYNASSDAYTWNDGYVLDEICWENTDGQIVSTENLYEGANRITSAIAYPPGENKHYLRATYNHDGSYKRTDYFYEEGDYGYEDSTSYTYTITPTDEYGSKKIDLYIEEEGYFYHYDTYQDETYKYDNYGLLLLEEINRSEYSRQVSMPHKEYTSSDHKMGNPLRLNILYESYKKRIGFVDYDNTHGYPLSWTLSKFDVSYENNNDFSFENDVKAEYSDYQSFVSSLNSIEADKSCVYEYDEWYNISGQKISRPANTGIYLHRVGDKVKKIFIR